MADEEKGDYSVGFGKPPRQTRFRHGQSGNPKGAKNLATLMEKVLKEPVVISENGRRRRITKREAMLKQLVNRAAGGDPRAIQLLLGEIRQLEARLEAAVSDEAPLDQGDRLVLQQIYQRFASDGQGEADGDPGSEPERL
jgi:hypothetical protein